MKEPRLPEFAKDVNTDIYRVTILPTWGNSIAVRVQRHGELYGLSARRLDGQAGFEIGKLVESKDVSLRADDSNKLAVLIQNLNFFQMSTHDDVRGNDGDEWIIEGVSQGKYHVAVRWCASSYEPEETRPNCFPCSVQIPSDQIHSFRKTPKQRPQTYLIAAVETLFCDTNS